jgi:outer membrane protein assembly factor BamB
MSRGFVRSLRRQCVLAVAFAGSIVLLGLAGSASRADDWPQWRGLNRDGKSTDFKAPKEWPKELTQKWKVTVGDGVATPALVGDKLYVFSREKNSEVTRCLNANTGKEIWNEKYDAPFRASADQGFPGPRCTPAVADGKVVTFGVNGMLVCRDESTGKLLWQTETKGMPKFHTSSSPIIVGRLVVVQIGSEGSGSVTAFDIGTGKEQWTWNEDGTSYASPIVVTLRDKDTPASPFSWCPGVLNNLIGSFYEKKLIVAATSRNIVALHTDTGKLAWKTAFTVTGRGYNASTPLVDGQTVIFSGSNRGTRGVKLEKDGDKITGKEVWNNKDNSVMYNSPVFQNGHVYGLTSGDSLFCVNTETGKTAWTESLAGGRGYGNIVDAGSVLFALPPTGTMTVFEANPKEFKKLASYKVGASKTYAYPIVTGNRIYVKDADSVILWTVE